MTVCQSVKEMLRFFSFTFFKNNVTDKQMFCFRTAACAYLNHHRDPWDHHYFPIFSSPALSAAVVVSSTSSSPLSLLLAADDPAIAVAKACLRALFSLNKSSIARLSPPPPPGCIDEQIKQSQCYG